VYGGGAVMHVGRMRGLAFGALINRVIEIVSEMDERIRRLNQTRLRRRRSLLSPGIQRLRILLLVLLSLVIYADGLALDTDDNGQPNPFCTESYYQGNAPNFLNPALARDTQELCYDGLTVMYSGVTRTPLWSAEHLTRDRVMRAENLPRVDSFHEEPQIPEEFRSTLSDYRGSGFDRGHMSPNGDMGTAEQQYNSFTLANIVPQNSYNNQNPWRELEEATRMLVKQEGEAYVITGPAFIGSQLQKVGHVLVPTDIYKAVYFPRDHVVGVYFSPNDGSGQVEVISLAVLSNRIGLDLFPNLPSLEKNMRVNMPLSAGNSHRYPVHQARKSRQQNYAQPYQLQPAQVGLLVRMAEALIAIHQRHVREAQAQK